MISSLLHALRLSPRRISHIIYIYIYPGIWARVFVSRPGDIPGPGGTFFDFGRLFISKTALVSPWGDGSQQAGSNTAIESFWRWKFVEIWPFLLSQGVPGRSPKGPRASPGSPWEASGARGRSVRSLGSVSWARRYFVSSIKMSQNVNNRKKT